VVRGTDRIEQELETIEEIRLRVLGNPSFLDCSMEARHLVGVEIPRLMELIRRLRRTAPSAEGPPGRDEIMEALERLRRYVERLPGLVPPS